MYFEGEPVELKALDEQTQNTLAKTLETDFEDIEFYFIEYEGDLALISAETDNMFAIIKCPRNLIEDDLVLEMHAEFLIDDFMRTSLVDYALETNNKELFEALCEYKKAPAKEPVKLDRTAVIDSVQYEDFDEMSEPWNFE